ncbi:hypothetical protein ACHAW5_007098, partial [Stephanodiscus triporus]
RTQERSKKNAKSDHHINNNNRVKRRRKSKATTTMYGDINGGGRRRGAVVSADLYRRVPRELTEVRVRLRDRASSSNIAFAFEGYDATKVGVAMSFLSVLIMVVLVVRETWAYVRTSVNASLTIDDADDVVAGGGPLLRLNFNITLYDVRCDFVSVDVWDALGTNLQNVTKDVTKWTIDGSGAIGDFHGRNVGERAVAHESHVVVDVDEVVAARGNSVVVVDLSPANAKEFHDSHVYAIVDYHAPWCVWCQRLAPTWEKFAAEAARSGWSVADDATGGEGREEEEEGEEEEGEEKRRRKRRARLGVGRVDCVEHRQTCVDERIMAFPTIRWYRDGSAVMPDYGGDRTVEALMEYVRLRMGSAVPFGDDDEEGYNFDGVGDFAEHHPGCMVYGHLMINRVPGNLHVEARSVNHEINSAMTNLTHRVNHLSFGRPDGGPEGPCLAGLCFGSRYGRFRNAIPENYKRNDPMKGKFFPTYRPHEAYHHYLKVIRTNVDDLSSQKGTAIYQVLQESQLILYNAQSIPEIKFLWDISPISVSLSRAVRPWYDYATNLLAIVGGTYTTLGLINATILRILKPKRL